MTTDTAPRLITCLLPQGHGLRLQQSLFKERGLTRVDLSTARGFIGSDPRNPFHRVEKDIVSVVVEADECDDVFAWLWAEPQLAGMEGGFVYVVRLSSAMPYRLPEEMPLEPFE